MDIYSIDIGGQYDYDHSSLTQSKKSPKDKYMLRSIICVSILVMIMVIIMMGFGSYIYITKGHIFNKLSKILSIVNEDSVIGAVQYMDKVDEFVKTLNITGTDIENGIIVGIQVGKAVTSIPNISLFIRDISYLVEKICSILSCR